MSIYGDIKRNNVEEKYTNRITHSKSLKDLL